MPCGKTQHGNYTRLLTRVVPLSGMRFTILCALLKWVFVRSLSTHHALTHWGWVIYIYVYNTHTHTYIYIYIYIYIRDSRMIIICSDNVLSPHRRQAIIWTNAGILLIGPFRNKLQWNRNQKCIYFHSRKCIWKCLQIASISSRPECGVRGVRCGWSACCSKKFDEGETVCPSKILPGIGFSATTTKKWCDSIFGIPVITLKTNKGFKFSWPVFLWY